VFEKRYSHFRDKGWRFLWGPLIMGGEMRRKVRVPGNFRRSPQEELQKALRLRGGVGGKDGTKRRL